MFKKKITNQEVIKKAIIAGLAETAYIFAVGVFFLVSGALFHPGSRSMIVGIACVLLLLVLSVGVSGLLIFGRPAYYFFQKKYREAFLFSGVALATLLIVFSLLILGEIFIY